MNSADIGLSADKGIALRTQEELALEPKAADIGSSNDERLTPELSPEIGISADNQAGDAREPEDAPPDATDFDPGTLDPDDPEAGAR